MSSLASRRASGFRRPLRRPLLCLLVSVLALVAPAGDARAATAAGDGADGTLLRVAEDALAEVRVLEGSPRDPTRVFTHALPRYFLAYQFLNADAEERRRVLTTTASMLDRFTERLYRAAAERAGAEGAARIGESHLEDALEELLPRRPTPYDSVVFFPQAPPAERLEIETFDVEALRDTGLPWSSLLRVAREEELELPIETDAARRLGEGVAAYAIALLRLGGQHAREERAFHVESRHLRQAGKTISARADSREPGPGWQAAPPPAAPGDGSFVEVTTEAGIRFRHVSSHELSRFRRTGPDAPTFSGGGAAAGDLDGDGWPDLVLCGGDGCAAYRNRRVGTFEDVTDAAGVRVPGEARMPILADLDNDGDRDLFVTYAEAPNRLFENLGGGRFRDLADRSGLRLESEVSGPAVAVDVDGDALLDLYVGNFGDYRAGASPWIGPDAQNAMPNRLYRNLGGLRFEDVTESSGTGNTGWAQALSHFDFDLDGDQDLYVANDFGRNELLANRGDGTFEPKGGATGADDRFHGMNVAFSDLNRDLHPDVFVTNIWSWNPVERRPEEVNSLLLSKVAADGTAVRYELASEAAGLAADDTGWSWAGQFFDADLDGDDDLLVVNGLNDYNTFSQLRPHPEVPGAHHPHHNRGEANLFYEGRGGASFARLEGFGAELAGENSRAAALLDHDHDGDLDVLVTTFHSWARLFRNDAPPPGSHWLEVELVGDPERGSNLDAIGARVVARGAGDLYAWRMVTGGGAYLSMNALPVHLGLGALSEVDLEIVWPNGERQLLPGVTADRRLRVRQGVPEPEVLPSTGVGAGAGADAESPR